MSDHIQAKIEWLSDRPLLIGRSFLFKTETDEYEGSITKLKNKEISATRGASVEGKLEPHQIGVVNISLTKAVNVKSGERFHLFDLDRKTLLAKGVFLFSLYRSANIKWQRLTVTKNARAALMGQRPVCIWLTGLSGSGKSTIANVLEKKLFEQGRHTYLLDGDNIRHGLNRDLGFTEVDRVENIRRVAEVAKLMVDAGLIVIASFISPFHAERQMARQLFSTREFIEVFVDTPLEECEKRDVKGLYGKARRGELKNFTGIDSAYERPNHPELRLDTCQTSAEACAEAIILSMLNFDSAD